MKKAIAMKCSQKDWDSIKDKFTRTELDSFNAFPYLTNNYQGHNGCIENINECSKFDHNREIHETFNAKIFLNACGIDCDVYEITKEQVLEMSSWGNSRDIEKVKEWFPSVFEKELEVGRWYKGNQCLFRIVDFELRHRAYGFNIYKEWMNESDGWNFKNLIEATPQEVESALICEARKRGFELGYIAIRTQEMLNEFRAPATSYVVEIESETFNYSEDYNSLTIDGRVIFINGKWATIIETITQFKKLKNYLIKK